MDLAISSFSSSRSYQILKMERLNHVKLPRP